MKNTLEIESRHQQQSFMILDELILVDQARSKHKVKHSLLFEENKDHPTGLNLLPYRYFMVNFAFFAYLLITFVQKNDTQHIAILLILCLAFVIFVTIYFLEHLEKTIKTIRILKYINTKITTADLTHTPYHKQTDFFRLPFFNQKGVVGLAPTIVSAKINTKKT